ncbi:MAG: DUF3014 domain-containing protein [Nitrospirota bacterium]|nr:DUF3014 domain-containing protein [Nitrospirota bacterium]
MKNRTLWVYVIGLAAVVAVILYFRFGTEEKPPPAKEAAASAPAAQPSRLHPLAPPPEGFPPLPALNESDGLVQELLGKLLDRQKDLKLFITENFIRRIVVTVDNLPKPRLPRKYLPVRSPRGKFLAREGTSQTFTIDQKNYRRYSPYVTLAEHFDTEKIVAFYTGLYPLFQEAYRELGYPDGYFNDRLIEVIDHLLKAPEVSEPVVLTKSVVGYTFEDPKLEALSSGQKILLRIGASNASVVRQKLGDIRNALTGQAPVAGATH